MEASCNDISLLSGSPESTFIHPKFDFSDADVILSVTGRCGLEGSGSSESDTFAGEADSSFQISPKLHRWMEEEDPEWHPGTTLFRVHKCALSRASGLFADMFTLPQPSTQDTIDGLPVIYMHDDPIDIYGFLIDLYNEDSLEHHPLRQTTFNRMSSLVRLSRKYSLAHLAATALASLRSDWPTTFEEWERTELRRAWITYANARTCSKPHDRGTGRGPEYDVVEPCGVIRFAREEGIPEILPAAFYHLSRLSSLNRPLRPEPDTEGQKHSHGCSVKGRGYAMTSAMTPADWATLMIGKGEIRSWFVEFRQYGWQSIHAKNCEAEDPNSCVLSAQGGWKTYWEEIVEERTRKVLAQDGLDVVEILRDLGHFVLHDANLCPRCRIRAGITVGSARLAFWDGLPDFFRLKRPNPWCGTWIEGEPVDCFEQSI